MRIVEITRKFIANDGSEFDTEAMCITYEATLAHFKVGKSDVYVGGTIYSDGTAYMRRFKKNVWKNGTVKWVDNGMCFDVKYAYKFKTFLEAYEQCGDSVMTLEQAEAATKIKKELNATKKLKQQRYVCEYDNNPSEDGEYITELGMLTFEFGWWNNGTKPKFWMRKVKLTEREY